jgi:hypothetical protein
MIKHKIFILILCGFSGCATKNVGEVSFSISSGKVDMDYHLLDDFNVGPRANLYLEIFNNTNSDTVFTPIYNDTWLASPDENSSFKLVVDKDTLHLSGRRFTIGKQGYGNNYELILFFEKVREENKPSFIVDSTYYKNKLISCLENGEVIFTDYRSKKTVHVPKSPDFKITMNW